MKFKITVSARGYPNKSYTLESISQNRAVSIALEKTKLHFGLGVKILAINAERIIEVSQ